ncbi:putative propanoyl-CoA C-acyltransferase [Paraburkholderia xenovorans LB400]|uniref:Thiolase n=1 Tax=Paraburkholderia xenovorans (strain LB400) TaxID=266265 RepID=Q13GQ0_PARXL|nr:thiolase family protein [Paraburkholderia xenovorans]ABE36739.1 Putative thiolase [Paraburkholderia xenovorans LB400]AIP34885.1 putative propanoyl-CoA C-acyltransferase [Paraburkholderia xenovorans LB400]
MTMNAFITGAYDTAVGKLPGSSCMSLHTEAALGAIGDAGLRLADIDGVLCAYSFTEPHLMLGSVFCEALGIHPGYCAALQAGGATACIMVMQAAALVASGQCRHVLVVTGDNRLSGLSRDGAVAALAEVGHPQFERPFGISVPASYALVARRYMHETGVTSEQLAAIAVEQRRHAARHPKAHRQEPITVADVLASKPIATPLHMLDCCLISDGGAALVISSGEASRDTRVAPIVVLGAGQGHTHEHIIAAPSLTSFGCKASAQRAFARAGVGPAEIDVAEIYDSFTITLAVELESMGFFERGEAGVAAARGELGLGGRLPCNTHGGLLSYGHSGAAGGMFHAVEAVHQLRGDAGARQVEDAKLAFVHGDGGILSAHCSLVLGAH